MTIDKKWIKSYNNTRISRVNKRIICHAPFQSINFTQNGNATVCCYNRTHVLGCYPTDNLKKIWFGKEAQQLREFIKKNDLTKGCETCAMQIESNNFASVHARHFDFQSDHPIKHLLKKIKSYFKTKHFVAYPRVIEFELSNTCNLECVMCNGYFSSSIRKNKENKPPMKMVFDDHFIDQLTEFIPHLTDAKFLGGEPFLIPIYFKIWDKIKELNPACRLHITTNASIINEKSWEILEQLKSTIIVSIDSLDATNYNRIREGADFNLVMQNVEKLHAYTKNNDSDMNFSVCPMTLNWREMPAIIQHGIDKKIYIYFNTVFYPQELSLKHISRNEAEQILSFYNEYQFNGIGHFYAYNLRQIEGLKNMIRYWHHL